ncbi:unnamed protein product, partial [Rotaria sp. Silwood2]
MSTERRLSDLRNLVSGLYTLGATIGTGHFAVVKLARHVFTQKEVAVKVIDKTKLDDISKAHLFQEVMCMKLVQHPNVVRLYEVIDTPNKLYLILEFGDGGDMYDYIMKHANGLNESTARATIGTGHFAVVKLARHVFTQKEVAVKVIDKTKLDD